MPRSFNSLIFLIVFCFPANHAWSKDLLKYTVSQIPVELMDNANSVVRYDETFVELGSPSKITVRRTYAVTILKESALSNSLLSISYGKFNRVSGIEAIVYNSAGEKVKRIRNEDILDLSDIADGTVYSDYRRKYIDPKYQTYPFTIEYEYSVTYYSAFFLPSWTVFKGYNTSVERSIFTIETPDGYDLRFRENKISQDKTANNFPGKKTVKWSASNFKARNPEPFSPDIDELYPGVTIAPSRFEMDNYSGNMQTWKDFGRFITVLNEKQNILPEETLQKMKVLVKDCKDDYEKVNLVYEYAQKKNRYISIQVGIGGWQAINAETVDRLSYGDCKALSNYTKSLLYAVGIRSICALVGAGDNTPFVDSTFSRNTFNHMILCVPLKHDSIWLECTDSFVPGGYLGRFTDDRFALLVEGEDSHLVRTPSFKRTDNLINTSGKVTLESDGNATATFRQNFSGSFYGDLLRLKQINENDRRNSIIGMISIPSFNMTNYSIQENKSRKPSINLQLSLDLTNFSTMMGSRMMLKLNQFNPMTEVPRFVRKREFNLEIRRNRVENDTITYQLPIGYQVEALPPTVDISTDFGSFKSSTSKIDRSVQLIRHMEIYKGVKSPERYNEFREFLEKIAASDNAKCVLVKS